VTNQEFFVKRFALFTLLGFGVLACVVTELYDRHGGEVPEPATVQAKRREFDLQLEAVQARIKARHLLVCGLVEDRLSLAEVTDEFMELNRESPDAGANIRQIYAGADERQSTARQVIGYTERELEARHDLTPEARRRVLERLEAELREMYK
jgi:hypothetical protein